MHFARLTNAGLLSCIRAYLCTVLKVTPAWGSLSCTFFFLLPHSTPSFRNCSILSKISWPWLKACAITHSSTHHTQCMICALDQSYKQNHMSIKIQSHFTTSAVLHMCALYYNASQDGFTTHIMPSTWVKEGSNSDITVTWKMALSWRRVKTFHKNK